MDAEAPNVVSTSLDKSLTFKHFPGFAKFIREKHLFEYIQIQIDLSREMNLPIMKLIQHIPDDELLQMGIPVHTEFLEAVENNTLNELLQKSLKNWENDELGILGRNDIATEDITVGAYVRKKAFMKFLPFYTNDPHEIIAIVKEIDDYNSESITSATNTYVNILKERITAHAHFIERITNTSPGATYVYDLDENKDVFVNNKLVDLLGYSINDIHSFGAEKLAALVHPDDIGLFQKQYNEILNLEEGNIITIDCRAKHKAGHYIWVRNHISAFKRNNEHVTQIIGILFNIEDEKQKEERLKTSEEQLLEAQELAEMGSFVLDVETQQVVGTPEFYKIFGCTAETYNRTLVNSQIHPADIDRVVEAREKAIAENSIFDSEYRSNVKGKEKVIWARGVVSEKNGKKTMKGTIMDVTERKHIIQRLQRSEELYKQAQAVSHIGNWAWDLTQNKLNWSEELYRIYGLDPATEITNDIAAAMNHPDDIEMIKKIMDEARETHEPYDFYYRIISPTGQLKIVHAKGNVLVDHAGNAYKMLGTVQDVTERQLLIEKLQRSEELYKQAQAMSHIGNWEWYVEENKIVWTDELYRIYGLENTNGYLDYDSYISRIHPDDKEEMLQTIQNCLASKQPYETYHRIILDSGEIKYLHGKGDLLLNSNGDIIKLYGTAQDITKEALAERALHQKNIELMYSNASLEEFAYVASHDLKEPLRKISTFGDMMLKTDSETLSNEGKNYLEKIIASAQRMQRMISDLMALSTIAGNNNFEPYDLNEILTDVTGLLEFNIRKKEAIINYHDLPVVKIEVSQFRQLFQNLISNSLKFSRPGAQPVIDITASRIPSSEAAKYGLSNINQYLKLELSDNGIGFENEYANKIFTIFQRLHSKSEFEGNGIGLAICKKVVENHKGIIIASGEPNKGAKFTIIIPE